MQRKYTILQALATIKGTRRSDHEWLEGGGMEGGDLEGVEG